MPVTINKIAELAGVSIGTVDRVINNRGNVSKDVEERIRKIARELNYKPNLTAKSLALRKKAPKIGVIYHVQHNYFIEEVRRGVSVAETELSDYGISVITKFCKDYDAADQLKLIDMLIAEGVSAIAITPINDPCIIDKVDQLIQENFPIFCFINEIETKNPHIFVGIDAYKTGQLAAGLFNLIAGPNEKLAVVSPYLKMLSHIQRIDGLKETIKSDYANIEIADICEIPFNDIEVYKAVKEYFKKNTDITCLWYATSFSDGGITALKELDLLYRVKIISIDLQEFTKNGLLHGYILATISQKPFLQGYTAMKIIFNYLLTGENEKLKNYIDSEVILKENMPE